MNDAMLSMVKARANLVLDHPFFGSLALRLRFQEDPTCKTIWTDGITLGFNPEFTAGLKQEELRGVLAHEVMHLANAHHTRRQHREPGKWNMACDMAINPLLIQAGARLPEGYLTGSGKAAEQEYAGIPDDPDGNNDGSGNGGSDPGGCGEVRDFPGNGADGNPSPADMQMEEQEWKIAVTQAAQQAKAMGKLPGGFEQFIKELVDHKVPWAEVLRNFIERTAKNDYNWNRPSRRYLQAGFVLPSLHSNELGEIVVAVDTSGSEWQMQQQFASELSAILETFQGVNLTVIYCDYRIRGVESFTSDDLPLQLNPQGGGGTDFEPVFEHIADDGIEPAALIYLTDLEGTFPRHEPDYPVLWVDTYGKYKPPFGEHVKMEGV